MSKPEPRRSTPKHAIVADQQADSLRGLQMRHQNLQRSPKASAREKLDAELAYREAQLTRALDWLMTIHVMRSDLLSDLAELDAAEAEDGTVSAA